MEGPMGKILRLAAVTSLVAGTVVLVAGAALPAQADSHQSDICTGTFKAPGVLAGTYERDLIVSGVCVVNGGAAVAKGGSIRAPRSAPKPACPPSRVDRA